jgi:transcriptional regulator with XRE-family HTH domain
MTTRFPTTVFGKRLRQARKQADIPQDKLGVAIGLDEGTASARMSRYESGVHAPPFETAAKIAKVLRIPTAFLYNEDDELADLLLAWNRLPDSTRRHIRALIDAALTEK